MHTISVDDSSCAGKSCKGRNLPIKAGDHVWVGLKGDGDGEQVNCARLKTVLGPEMYSV